MKTIATLLVSLFMVAVAFAGNISGKVQAEGKEGADAAAAGGKYSSHALRTAQLMEYSEMRDFVVYIEGPLANAKSNGPMTVQVITHKPEITQQKAIFDPHVLPVVVGTTIEWPNKDDIYHNVFSDSPAKQFDLGLYKDPEVKKVPFDQAGRVDVFCSIHSSMHCVVLVLENPYFAVSNDKGLYTITNVPPGTYKLKAWHDRMPAQVREIVVPEKGDVKADFKLGITGLPKY